MIGSNLYTAKSGLFSLLAGVRGWKWTLVFLLNFFYISSQAHEIRPAYLEIKQTTDSTYNVLWKIPLISNKSPKLDPVLPTGFQLHQQQESLLADAYIRKYEGFYSNSLNGKTIAIQGQELTLMDVLVQIHLLDESSYTLLLQPDKPKATIPIEPNKWEVVKLYIQLGVEHILLGIDHLLFVLGLLLLVQGIGPLIKTITAFTVAHSITLGAATFDLISLPSAPVEAVIALSILFLAREYIVIRTPPNANAFLPLGKSPTLIKRGGDVSEQTFFNVKQSLTAQYPWVVAFTFGLLHGFGFAGALSEIGFPQKEVPLALFTFNVGVELGQLLFIGVVYLFLFFWNKLNLSLPKGAWRVVPYAIGTVASFWLVERVLAFF